MGDMLNMILNMYSYVGKNVGRGYIYTVVESIRILSRWMVFVFCYGDFIMVIVVIVETWL